MFTIPDLPRALLIAAALACLAAATPPAHAIGAEEPPPNMPAEKTDLSPVRALIKQGDYKGAIARLNKMAEADSKNADIYNLLGYSHRKSGNLQAAFANYKTALDLNPKHLGAHEYIGEAYLMNKQPEQAEKHLATLAALCGKGCEEYQDLDKAIKAYRSKNRAAR
jgi:Flp pilus assembly protein TadD